MIRPLSILIPLITAILGASITYFVMQTNFKPDVAKSEQLINQATNNQVIILKHFDSYANLEGFVLQGKNPKSPIGLLYTDRAGQYLIYGQIFTNQGLDLAHSDYLKYVQPAAALEAFNAAAKTNWLQQGSDKAPHKLYVLADPNCRFCNALYEQLQPAIKDGQLAVRWVIVGFLKPTSKGRSLAILGAKNPLAALAENEQGFNATHEEGGLAPLNDASADIKAKFEANMTYMQAHAIISTPTMLYRSENNLVQMQDGLPKDVDLNALVNSFSDKWQ